MASDALTQQMHQLDRRITALEAERPHLATKADLERQTRILVMWLVATGATLSGVFVLGFLYIIERLPG
jgi:hypothetical protein